MKTSTIRYLLAAAGACTLLGCAEKLTYERWKTVHEGMSADAVEATLGTPWQETDQAWVYYNGEKGITAQVFFQDGKVNGTTWTSPEHGMQGKSPNVNKPGDAEQTHIQTINK